MAQLIAIATSQAGSARVFMAGEALRAAAEQLGQRIALSVQSSLATHGSWSVSELGLTDAVITAADLAANRSGVPTSRIFEATPHAALANAGVVASTAPIGAASHSLQIAFITSCPTGVARRFMVAEASDQGAKALGYQIKVKTQSWLGAQNTLLPDDSAVAVAVADPMLIAADAQMNWARFSGKRLYATGTKADIHDAASVFAQVDEGATVLGEAATSAAAPPTRRPQRPVQKPDFLCWRF